MGVNFEFIYNYQLQCHKQRQIENPFVQTTDVKKGWFSSPVAMIREKQTKLSHRDDVEGHNDIEQHLYHKCAKFLLIANQKDNKPPDRDRKSYTLPKLPTHH